MQAQVQRDEVEPERKREHAKPLRMRLETEASAVVTDDLVPSRVGPRQQPGDDDLSPLVVLRVVLRTQAEVEEAQEREPGRSRPVPVDDTDQPIALDEQVAPAEVSVAETARKIRESAVETA